MRIPHALVGALCLGFALANLARPAVVPALGVAVALASVGLAATDPRFRAAGARVRGRGRRLGLGQRRDSLSSTAAFSVPESARRSGR